MQLQVKRSARGRLAGAALLPVLAGGLLLGSAAQGQAPAFVKETAAGLPGFDIHRPANLASRRGPVPVVVWANGGCAPTNRAWIPLFERWASEGYVVLSINEPGAAMPGRPAGAPPGGPPGADAGRGGPPPGPPGAGPPGAGRGGPPGGRGGGMNTQGTVDKQVRAIDWAEKETATRGGPYAGRFDMTHLVVGGNSCGGISSLNLSAKDKRPDAIFVLSGSSIGPSADKAAVEAVMGKITIPTLWIVGGPEDIARAAANMDYESLPAGVPGVVIERASGDHGLLSTSPLVMPDAAEIGLLWFKAALDKDRAAIATVTTRGCAQCDPKVWPTVKAKNLAGR